MEVVPVDLDPLMLVALNAGTLFICLLALLLPSMLITRIAPAKAIRFG